MGSVFKKTATKAIPNGARLLARKGKQWAEWIDAKQKRRQAPVTTGKDGSLRIVLTARTFTAKYRDGAGIFREVPTGCRDEQAARGVLGDLERRAERVKGKILTAAEDRIIDHLQLPTTEHLTAYLTHLRSKGDSDAHVADTRRLVQKIAAICGFGCLADIRRETVEAWMVQRAAEGMAARTRNSYLQALRSLCRWCVETGRLASNPLERVAKADEAADRRRTRRALSEAELGRLLDSARR